MKIGILTHQLQGNYGGILQNFALQQVLKELGHEPYTIDYLNKVNLFIKIRSIIKRVLLRCILNRDLPIRGWTTRNEDKLIYQNTRLFVSKYINTTDRVLLKSINVFDNKFDAIIVGSDQVWRYAYFGNLIDKMFLSPFPRTKLKLSYAASFGTDIWEMPVFKTKLCAKLIKQFNAVSVREESGVALCKDYLQVNATHVLDPTLLLKKEAYLGLIEQPANVENRLNTLSAYILDVSGSKTKIIEHVLNKYKMEYNSILPSEKFEEVGIRHLSACIVEPIELWLSGINKASLVITDSFHGTVFSIIFNRPFIVLSNASRGIARISSLLNMLDLNDRLVIDNSIETIDQIIQSDINWESINEKLDNYRDLSISFLSKNLCI